MPEGESLIKQIESPIHVGEAVETTLTQLSEIATAGLRDHITRLETAYREVRQEQPHLFIEYRQPKNAKEKLKMRRRATKIKNRAKKRHAAVQIKLEELGTRDPKEIVREAVTEVQIRQGFASPEAEVDFLQSMYERE